MKFKPCVLECSEGDLQQCRGSRAAGPQPDASRQGDERGRRLDPEWLLTNRDRAR